MAWELAQHYGYTDVNGNMPNDRVMKSVRAEMQGPPLHWLPSIHADDPVSEHRNNTTISKIK